MIELEAIRRFKAINKEGMNMTPDAIPYKNRPWNHIAADKSTMCTKAISRLNHPGDIRASRREASILDLASGCAVPGKIIDIIGVPKESENRIINSTGEGYFACKIYAEGEKNSARAPNHDEINSAPYKIATEVYGFHLKAKKRALKDNT